MVGGNLCPVMRFGVLCMFWLCLFDSGEAGNFVSCNCVVDAMKIDQFLFVLCRMFCCGEKIKFIY